MIFPSHHIKVLRVAFALLVFSASSGVTALVRTCTAPGMDCCGAMPASKNDCCDTPSATVRGILLKSDFSCHTSTLVGGIAINAGLIEKESKTQLITSHAALVMPLASAVSGAFQVASRLQPALPLLLSPPSVDRYALIGSFLI